MAILSAHVTHQNAAMADIERLGREDPETLLSSVSRLPGVRECAVLSTCNRVELYTVTDDIEMTRRAMQGLIDGLLSFDASSLVRFLDGRESVHHLLRVASGLESMVLGEDQIQGQVREAFELAARRGHLGPVLSMVLRKAIEVGKRVRAETALNKGAASVGSAAVELAESKLGSLEDRNVLVIGAGEMATLIARHLAGKGPRTVFVSNRTHAKAVELAWELHGRAVRFDSLVPCLARSDVVLCATAAAHPVLTAPQVEEAMSQRDGRKLVVIDVSFPRNVDPAVAAVPGVQYCDIDGLRERAAENMARRRAEVRAVERIIAAELDALEARFREMRADELISLLYLKYNLLKEREVRKALNRIAAGRTVDEVLEDFGSSLTYKFLSEPTAALKEASKEGDLALLSAVGEVFKVEGVSDVPKRAAPKSASEPGH